MYLSDYLHDIPLKALKRIAARLGVSVEYQARIKFVNAIDRAFWDGALVPRLIRTLSPEGRLALSLVVFSYDAGVSENILLRKMEKLTGTRRREARDVLGDLVLSALIAGTGTGEPVYFSPRGVAEQARHLLLGDTVVPPPDGRPVPPASFPRLMEDVIALLAAVYREPAPLTLKGSIRRNVLEHALMSQSTEDGARKNEDGDHRAAFVTEYLAERGLLRFEGREATVTAELDGWLGLSMTGRTRDIISFALRYHLGDAATVIPFLGILAEMAPGAGIRPSVLARFLHENTTAPGGIARLQTRLAQIFEGLDSLGLLSPREDAFIMTDAGARFFRGEQLPLDGSISRHFSVQPTFEVLAGPELDPRVRFTLELMSCRKSRDVVVTSMLTRDGVARARARGMSAADILGFFETHSRTPLPQNVRFSIEEWANAFGGIFFEKVTVMRFRDPEVCNGVMHIPDVAPFIRERLSETVVIVPAERVRVIAAHLRRHGFLPEIAGEIEPDPARSGTHYHPESPQELIAGQTLPEPPLPFVFPEEETSHPEADV